MMMMQGRLAHWCCSAAASPIIPPPPKIKNKKKLGLVNFLISEIQRIKKQNYLKKL